MKINRLQLPRVGQRIIRSVVAVALCFVIYECRGKQGIPFYSALAVLQCIQPYQQDTADMAKKRVTGTFVGAWWGTVVIFLQIYIFQGRFLDTMAGYLMISVFTGIVLYSTVVLGCKNTAYFSCVVFLSIVVMHISDESPVLFVGNRILDTLIGVAIAVAVNSVHFPRKKIPETLFVSGIDDTILNSDNTISPYSKVELNRIIDRGVNFTVSTIRTPASVREALDGVRLKYPIVAMDGAVLYDMNENSYLMKYQMSPMQVKTITDFLEQEQVQVFTNTVADDLLVIYYRRLVNQAEKGIYEKRRKSLYRNYVHGEEQVCENVVYLLLIDKKQKVEEVYGKMMCQEWCSEFRFVKEDSANYPGYTYIKIYHRDATRERMLLNLKAFLNIEKTVTIGSVEGKYDVVIQNSDKDRMIKQLKKYIKNLSNGDRQVV